MIVRQKEATECLLLPFVILDPRCWLGKVLQILEVGDAIKKVQHCTSLFPKVLPHALVRASSWQKHPTLANVWHFGLGISHNCISMHETQVYPLPRRKELTLHMRLATKHPLAKNDLPGGRPTAVPQWQGIPCSQEWAQAESPTPRATLPCSHCLCHPHAQGWAWSCTYEDKAVCSPGATKRAGPCTCSNPPASGAARHAEGDGREATAAVPEPGAAAQLTVRAWPGADVLLTWVRRESPAGPCRVQLQPKTKQENKRVNGTAPSSPMAP